MRDRVRQPLISIMAAGEVGKGPALDPVFCTCGGNVGPRKWRARDRLIDVVDAHGVVRCRAAKRVAVRRTISHINPATGVDQPACSIHRKPETERIGVAMAAMALTLRARVD